MILYIKPFLYMKLVYQRVQAILGRVSQPQSKRPLLFMKLDVGS